MLESQVQDIYHAENSVWVWHIEPAVLGHKRTEKVSSERTSQAYQWMSDNIILMDRSTHYVNCNSKLY